MTYCLGVLLSRGLVLASDSRTNAGVDQIAKVRKLDTFALADERMVAVLSAGNLATTQHVITTLRQRAGSGETSLDLFGCKTLFDAAQIVGNALRDLLRRETEHVSPYGDPGASFLVAGQIKGEAPRLFQIYTAGNFIEASPRTQFLQIGESKYGKPILDRALDYEMEMSEAAKCVVLSFDATMRSNLSVAPPVDILCYRTDSFTDANRVKLGEEDPYLESIRKSYGGGLTRLVNRLPTPPWVDDAR